ncbi:hypothetical protein MMC13_001258 [Lambiella insularis]|nr:hypothetical protein [Lambiella insularis]
MAEKSISGLAAPRRFITTHKEDGTSVFMTAVPEKLDVQPVSPTVQFYLPYVTSTFPIDMGGDADIAAYRPFIQGASTGLVNKGGSVFRVCNFAPGSITGMHRTLSLDYGIVIAGEVECVLDSGESRLMKVGDVTIQRGTNHAWRVPSKDQWARMIFILQEAKPLEIGGKKLEEDVTDVEGVPPSNV